MTKLEIPISHSKTNYNDPSRILKIASSKNCYCLYKHIISTDFWFFLYNEYNSVSLSNYICCYRFFVYLPLSHKVNAVLKTLLNRYHNLFWHEKNNCKFCGFSKYHLDFTNVQILRTMDTGNSTYNLSNCFLTEY